MLKGWFIKAALAALFLCGIVIYLLYDEVGDLTVEKAQLEKDLTAAITSNNMKEAISNINNIVVKSVIEEKNQLLNESEDVRNALRRSIKNNSCGNQRIPDDISNRLLDYANSLRTIMRTDSSGADSTVRDTYAMTYEDAILWIPSLLRTIGQCNADRKAIRTIEFERSKLR